MQKKHHKDFDCTTLMHSTKADLPAFLPGLVIFTVVTST
jgi:hypothetical protein